MAINDVKVKTKIQKLLHDNIARAGGDFHHDELDEINFTCDLEKSFKMTPIENCKSLEKIIKLSTVKVRGMINSRELKQSKFFKELFNNFEIELL